MPLFDSKLAMGDAELRARLLPIFNAFDRDGSGAISSEEMANVVSNLKIEMGPEQLAAMMADADPDGSGEVEFDELEMQKALAASMKE